MDKLIKQAVEEGAIKPKSAEVYEKYRWFLTSSKKMVIGGKNAQQNEELVNELIQSGKNYTVMHTKQPGSPFSIIQSDSPNQKDLEETAIFTASFSRAWKAKAKKVIIDIFKANQIEKKKEMKIGTFGVSGEKKKMIVEPRLYLTVQKGKLRAVPQEKQSAIIILPGNIPKSKIAEKIAIKLTFPIYEIIQALPAGEFKILNDN